MSGSPDVLMFWISFWLYLASFLLFVTYLAFRKQTLGWLGAGTMFAGFLPHTAGILTRWNIAGHMPLSNMYEYANLMAWMTVVTFGAIVWKYKRLILGTIVSPALIIIIVSASMLPKEASNQLVPALQSYWLAIHVSLAALAEGAFAVALGVSVTYLIKQRKQVTGNGGKLTGRLPGLETLDEINFQAIAIGYPLFTVGALFAGSIWAHEAWGTFWAWDPKEVGALVIWLFYTGYLHARLQHGWKGKRAAWLSIIGFAMILLSFAGNIFLGGNHAYG
jgi:cytochrome c-type biogenesis protein CcsB